MEHQAAHLGTADFDAMVGIKHVFHAQPRQGANTDQDRPCAGEPDANLGSRQRIGVVPTRRQVRGGLVEVRMVEWTEPRLAFGAKQVGGLQAERVQFIRRQIAAALTQVHRQVAQDIDQLQPFAEPDAVGEQARVIENGMRKKMCEADFRPKLADATRDTVGVILQFGVGQ